MKTKIIIIILLAIGAVSFISMNYFQTSIGPHDGTVKPAGDFNIEEKHIYPSLYTFLLDKKLKPINNKGISCEVKFILLDSTDINIPLKPYGNDGFVVETGSLKFKICRVYFNVFGKSVSAQFENEEAIAK